MPSQRWDARTRRTSRVKRDDTNEVARKFDAFGRGYMLFWDKYMFTLVRKQVG
jgi:hypothetical protein